MTTDTKHNFNIHNPYLQVMQRIHELNDSTDNKVILIAIDGKCGSGKTTLAQRIKSEFDCNVFHMDDFFLQDVQRTNERLQEVGGNVDYERFYDEVLQPLTKEKEISYRPFSCKTRTIQAPQLMKRKRINIIEGAYSMHPYFHDPYDLKIFLDIDEDMQISRIREREGETMLLRFLHEWIPKENAYFEQLVKKQLEEEHVIVIR